ncbi:F-box domain containing protein [Tanacetum coccineum]
MKEVTKDTTARISKCKKRKKNTKDTPDRISTLPDFIVHHILSYLHKDTKSLVRMSVLSKEWFALMESFPILYFRLDRSWFKWFSGDYDNEYIMKKFCKYVEHTVSRFCKQNISAHTLDIVVDLTNLEQVKKFERCLELVIEKGVEVLVIDVAYWDKYLPMLRLPNTLLSASLLTSLTLNKCELPSSLMVGVVKFKSLKLLSLANILIEEGVIEYLAKSCPLLEEIYLRYCYGFKMFCVKRHHNLLKVEIYRTYLPERIDVEAPNLSYFLLDISSKDKAPSMFLGSCEKLTTFCYRGFPLERFNDFLSNFPFLENVSLNLSSPENLKLSHHFLRRLELQSDSDLEEIDLNVPNLLLFKYYDLSFRQVAAMSRKDSSLAKGYMKCHTDKDFDILSFLKLRRFLEKNSFFSVLELVICWKLIHVEELKMIQSPPYKLEHVELKYMGLIRESLVYVALVDAVLWCCRPRSLTLELDFCIDTRLIAKYTYKKLLQHEDEGQTNIKFVLKSDYKCEQPFSDLNSLLKALSLRQFRGKITFIKEEDSYSTRLLQSANDGSIRHFPSLRDVPDVAAESAIGGINVNWSTMGKSKEEEYGSNDVPTHPYCSQLSQL